MTHEERVRHHMYETLEGIAEQSERIASLEELVLDMWRNGMCECDERMNCTTCKHGFLDRMRELGIEVD